MAVRNAARTVAIRTKPNSPCSESDWWRKRFRQAAPSRVEKRQGSKRAFLCRPDPGEELIDLLFQPGSFAGKARGRVEHLAGAFAGTASSGADFSDRPGNLLGADCGLLDATGDVLGRSILLLDGSRDRVADGKVDGSKLRVFYTTPPFVDYVWVARKDVGGATQKKFAEAFLRLAPGRDDKVLSILKGVRYAAVTDAEYQPVHDYVKKLSLF